MLNPTYLSKPRMMALAGLFILTFDGSLAAVGQESQVAIMGASSTFRPKNPPSQRPHSISAKPTSDRIASSKVSEPTREAPLDDKERKIRDAIEAGNKARDKSDYQTALRSYRRVITELDTKDERAHYGLGNVYSALYCSGSAIEAYRAALNINAKYSEALIGLSYVYLNEERYDDALQHFQQAVDLAPENVDARIGLGTALNKKGRSQEAVEQLSRILNNQSVLTQDRARVHMALGNIYQSQQKWKEAIAEAENSIRILPPRPSGSNQENQSLASAYVNLAMAKLGSATDQFTSLASRGVQDRATLAASAKQSADNIQTAIDFGYRNPSAHLLLSRARMYQARYPEAVKEINDYLAKIDQIESRLTSQDSSLQSKCDYAFERLKAYGNWFLASVSQNESSFEANPERKTVLLDQAVAKFKEAIRLKDDALGHGGLGGAYFRKGMYEEAIKEYEKAIILENEKASQASDFMMIGLSLYRLERYEEAIQKYQEAIKLDDTNALLYDSLATVYEALASKYVAKGNVDETFKLLSKAGEVRKSSPTNPDPYYYLGATYSIRFVQKGDEEDFSQAIKWLDKAIAIKPSYHPPYHALGVIYWRHSKADLALANYEKAIEYDPTNPGYYVNMGLVYFELKGNDNAAIERFRKAIAVKVDHAEAYWQLGNVYRFRGDGGEAITQTLKAIQYDPKALQAYFTLGAIFTEKRDYVEAQKHLNKALELAPTDSRPYKELAKFFEAQQKNEEAIQYYGQAIDNLRSQPFAKELYGCRIVRLKRRYEEAIRCFQNIKVPGSEPADSIFHDLGLTYVASKNKKAALAQYEQLKQMKSTLAQDLLRQTNEMK